MTNDLKPTNDRLVTIDGDTYKDIKYLRPGKRVIIQDYDSGNVVTEHIVTLRKGEGETLIYNLNDRIGVVDYTFGEWRVMGYVSDTPKLLPAKERNDKNLIECLQEHIDSLDKNGYGSKDIDHWVYETAMEYAFGNDIWRWVNKKSQ